MFKNYLTYSFVVGFQRGCRAIPVPLPFLDRVTRSTSRMVDQFAKSVEATSTQDELKHVAVTLICLRDTKELLQEAVIWSSELESQFIVLKKRLEQLCMQLEEKVESEKFKPSRVTSAS